MTDLTCSDARDSISARIDGELDLHSEQMLDTHVSSCTSCEHYQNDAYALHRALRMRSVEADQVTNASASTIATDVAGSLKTVTFLRYALFVIGASLVILNFGSIISPDGSVAAHLGRHDGVFGTALGIGMLAVAARPHRAIGLVPITSAVALLMTIVALADLVTGNANLLAEAIHVLQFAGLICLWVISGGPSRLPKHIATVTQWSPRSLPITN